MSDEAIVRIRLPKQLPEPLSHYTDAVRAGDHIWISGMLGVDAAGALSDAGVVSQAEQVFRNLRAVLDQPRVRRGFDLPESVVDAGSGRGRDDRHRRHDCTAIGLGSGRLLSRRSYRQQIDPHLGFGHLQPACERCMKMSRKYGYGLGIVRNGSWILQIPLFGGYSAIGVLPAVQAHLDRPRPHVQAEHL